MCDIRHPFQNSVHLFSSSQISYLSSELQDGRANCIISIQCVLDLFGSNYGEIGIHLSLSLLPKTSLDSKCISEKNSHCDGSYVQCIRRFISIWRNFAITSRHLAEFESEHHGYGDGERRGSSPDLRFFARSAAKWKIETKQFRVSRTRQNIAHRLRFTIYKWSLERSTVLYTDLITF